MSASPTESHRVFSLLIKPASADCNLECGYCFYHNRDTDPYAGAGTRRMSDEVLESMIYQMMELSPEQAIFSWQGGEPLLMGYSFFNRVVELQMEFGHDGQVVGNAVQTNATLIDERWARFFARYNFLIGVSLDGMREVHDHFRKDKKGRGSWERVMRAIGILKKYNVEFNCLAVVTSLTQTMADELYDFFLSHDLRYVQFIPCVETTPDGKAIAPFSVTPEGYGEFLCRLFDRWYNDGEPQLSERFFDNVVSAYVGYRPESCEMEPECGQYVVVEYNGDVYPCDFHVRKEWYLGNLLEKPLVEIASSPRAREFARRKAGPFKPCESCKWRWLCNRGCQRLRGLPPHNDMNHHYLCPAYRRFFNYSESRFKALAEKVSKEIKEGKWKLGL